MGLALNSEPEGPTSSSADPGTKATGPASGPAQNSTNSDPGNGAGPLGGWEKLIHFEMAPDWTEPTAGWSGRLKDNLVALCDKPPGAWHVYMARADQAPPEQRPAAGWGRLNVLLVGNEGGGQVAGVVKASARQGWDIVRTWPTSPEQLATDIFTIINRLHVTKTIFSDLVQKMHKWEHDFLNNFPQIVYQLDLEGKFVSVNAAVGKLGYEPEELIGQHFFNIVHPEDRDKVSREKAVAHFQAGQAWPQARVIDERRTDNRLTTGLHVRLMHKDNNKVVYAQAVAMGYHKKRLKEKMVVDGTLGVLFDVSDSVALEELRLEKDLLERYFAPEMIQKIKNKGDRDLMLSEKVRATILFVDLRNFTTLSEQIPPEKVAELLNWLYTDIMDLITKNGGSTNKIIGDALLATFGCPLPVENTAVSAARAALDIHNTIAFTNQVRPKYLKEPLKAGLGLATGEIFAGNIGSFKHKEYTVIGDAVNTASRLEGLTKRLPASILMDAATQADLDGQFQVDEFKNVPIKGKAGFQTIYGLTGRQEKAATSGLTFF